MKTKLDELSAAARTDLMNTLARQIEAVCALRQVERPAFALLLFDGGEATYVSNCLRDDAMHALRCCVDQFEHQRKQAIERN